MKLVVIAKIQQDALHGILAPSTSFITWWMSKPDDHWSCIAHLIAEDMLKSAVIEEKKFKN